MESKLYPDGRTVIGKVYGSECICGHRKGVHFINIKTHEESCEGYGKFPCSCSKYEQQRLTEVTS